MATLIEGNTLKDRYKIVEVISDFQDLSIYKGKDLESHNSLVYIREIKLDSKGYGKFNQASLDLLVEISSSVSHRCLPKFIEYYRGVASGYIIEEFVNGQTFAELLKQRSSPYSFNDAYAWMIDLCDLIHYFHSQEKQIILRGLTPETLLVTPSGELKLISLDKARYFNPLKETSDTLFVWNPGYTSPEQYGTQKSDVRADVYSFGAVFYHMFTKQNLGAMHFNFPPVSKFNPSFNAEQDAIFARCLHKDINQRYQSILAVKNDLLPFNPHKASDEDFADFLKDEKNESFKEKMTKILKKIKDSFSRIYEWLFD